MGCYGTWLNKALVEVANLLWLSFYIISSKEHIFLGLVRREIHPNG
jgi:hypothetical protein